MNNYHIKLSATVDLAITSVYTCVYLTSTNFNRHQYKPGINICDDEIYWRYVFSSIWILIGVRHRLCPEPQHYYFFLNGMIFIDLLWS